MEKVTGSSPVGMTNFLGVNFVQFELENDKDLSEIVTKLKDHFKPMKVFIFGSRAKGTSTPDSDYDLFLIVKNSDKSQLQRMQEARRLIWGRTIAVDIFIYTEAEFFKFNDEFSSIAHTVANEGVEI